MTGWAERTDPVEEVWGGRKLRGNFWWNPELKFRLSLLLTEGFQKINITSLSLHFLISTMVILIITTMIPYFESHRVCLVLYIHAILKSHTRGLFLRVKREALGTYKMFLSS